MREIKFRGYNEKLKKWVYGFVKYGHNGKHSHWCIQETELNNDRDIWWYEQWEVVEDSIGQYSGYIDINEEEIYEGDILRFGNYPFEEVRKAKVVYDNGFYIEILEGECPVLENKRKIEMKGDLEQYGLEVIGNEFEKVRNVR